MPISTWTDIRLRRQNSKAFGDLKRHPGTQRTCQGPNWQPRTARRPRRRAVCLVRGPTSANSSALALPVSWIFNVLGIMPTRAQGPGGPKM